MVIALIVGMKKVGDNGKAPRKRTNTHGRNYGGHCPSIISKLLKMFYSKRYHCNLLSIK